jgi:hypothetical protein
MWVRQQCRSAGTAAGATASMPMKASVDSLPTLFGGVGLLCEAHSYSYVNGLSLRDQRRPMPAFYNLDVGRFAAKELCGRGANDDALARLDGGQLHDVRFGTMLWRQCDGSFVLASRVVVTWASS